MKAKLLKIRRHHLKQILNLCDDVDITQISVNSWGELYLLLESEQFPLVSIKGRAPDMYPSEMLEITKESSFSDYVIDILKDRG